MVRDIEHRRCSVTRGKHIDHGGDELVRLSDGIVIRIAEHEAVGRRARVAMVDREEAFLLGIAVTIAEVATVGMQYHEELGVVTSHQATQVGEHIGVVEAALGLAELLAYRVVLVTLHSEEVDVAMVARLIGDVCRVEASLTEGREDALHPRKFIRA